MKELLTKFKSIFLTRGVSGSLLVDTHRKETFRISNELYDFIGSCEGKSIEEVLVFNEGINEEMQRKVINQLLEDEVLTSVPQNLYNYFRSISSEWRDPSLISNGIIDFNGTFDYAKFINELDYHGCRAIQIRFFNHDFNDKHLIELCELLNNTGIRSIELILNYNKTNITNNISEFLLLNQKVSSIVFFSAEVNESVYLEQFLTRITYTKSTGYSEKCCGVVNEQYFSPSLEHYLESLSYNTCLNRKVSSDINGYLKNCPSMDSSFGHINSSSIRNLLEDIEFTKMFHIKKDDIQVCSNCEYRHICTDCRAYTETPNNINSKPLKCGYDPETQTWSEWSNNPLKIKALEHYFPNGEF